MPTFFCMLSGRETDETERSCEHVIPYALGGSDGFATRDVSRTANGQLGTSIDAPFIGDFFMTFERWRRGLKSQKGNIPPLEFSGTVQLGGVTRQATYAIAPNLDTELTVQPLVDGSVSAGSYHVQCSPDQLDAIRLGIERKAEKHGLKVTQTSRNDERVERPEIHASLHLSRLHLVRGMLKIALGAGHIEYGYAWSRSDLANRMRECLWASPECDLTAYRIRGSVWPELDPRQLPILRVDDDTHVVWLKHSGPACVTVVLFGKYSATFALTDDIAAAGAIEDGTVYLIDSRSRKTVRRTFVEHIVAVHGSK